jgi:hypothetical protein
MTRSNIVYAPVLLGFAFVALGSGSKGESENTHDSSSTLTNAPAPSAKATPSASASADPLSTPDNACTTLDGLCTESYWGDDSDKKKCDASGGKFEKGGACPQKDTLLGTCAVSGDLLGAPLLVSKVYFYGDGPRRRSLGDAKGACSAAAGVNDGHKIVSQWSDGPAAKATPTKAPAKAPPKAAPKPTPAKK